MKPLVEVLLLGSAGYLASGLIFAIIFHRRGLVQMDPAAQGTGWSFRCLITPGIIALWPLLWAKWKSHGAASAWLGAVEAPVSPQAHRRGHRWIWHVLAVAVPLGLAAALGWRPEDSPSIVPTTTTQPRR